MEITHLTTIILFLTTLTVTIATTPPTPPNTHCTAGALFLSLTTSLTYSQEFQYNCSETHLQLKLKKLKSSKPDPFVSYFIRPNSKNKRNTVAKQQEEFGSGNYDDDDEDSEDSEELPENFHDDEENEIFPSIPSEKSFEIPIEPTPSIVSMATSHVVTTTTPISMTTTPPTTTTTTTVLQHFYSSSIKPDHVYIGSGDYILATPVVSMETTTTTQVSMEKIIKKLPKKVLNSGVKYEEIIHASCHEIKPALPWIQLVNSRNNTKILALPSNEEISDWEFELICENNSVVMEIYFSVRQRQRSRNWNHLWRVEFGTVERGLREFVGFLEGVRRGGRGDHSPEDLVVVGVNLREFPFWVEFVNESIVVEGVGMGGCPLTTLNATYSKLKNLHGNHFPHTYKIHSLTLTPYPGHTPCDKDSLLSITTTKKTPTTTPTVNFPPSIKNQIDKINGKVGSFLVYKIPNDFCYDPEDGDKVLLSLKKLETFENFHDNFWLQFDGKNNEIYGLPMETGEIEGVVVCGDRGGRTSFDSITISIAPQPPQNYSAEFSLHFTSSPWTPPTVRKFIDKLSSLLSPSMIVKSHTPPTKNSTHIIFKWLNSSNPTSEYELNEIRKILWSEEGGVNRGVKNYFAPEFNLSDSGGVVPIGGVLLGGATPVEGGGKDKQEFDFGTGGVSGGTGGVEGTGGDEEEDEDWRVWVKEGTPYLTTYIIPSILIAVLCLLSLIVACYFVRKIKDSSPSEMSTFEKKIAGGVPVIFQEELEQSLVARQQMQPQAERPVRPPSYVQQSASGGGGGGPGGWGEGGVPFGSVGRVMRPPHYNKPPPAPMHSNPPSYPDPYSSPSGGGNKYPPSYQPPPALSYYGNQQQQHGMMMSQQQRGPSGMYVPP